MFYYPMYFDPTYILVFIGVVLSLLASAKVKSTYAKYSYIQNRAGMTGREAAERILRQAGIYDEKKCFGFRMRLMVRHLSQQ